MSGHSPLIGDDRPSVTASAQLRAPPIFSRFSTTSTGRWRISPNTHVKKEKTQLTLIHAHKTMVRLQHDGSSFLVTLGAHRFFHRKDKRTHTHDRLLRLVCCCCCCCCCCCPFVILITSPQVTSVLQEKTRYDTTNNNHEKARLPRGRKAMEEKATTPPKLLCVG